MKTIQMSARTERQERILEGVAIWAAFYRANIHRFAADYLHVDLKLFQIILLIFMQRCTTFVLIGYRGIGKSFITAIFCVCMAILYPGLKVCIAAGTRGQGINVLEKIMLELKPNSIELANEIDEKQTKPGGQEAKIVFKNGSVIKVVTSSDSSRGNRAHVLIVDEFRMVKKDTIETILKKFLSTPRKPGFMRKPEYKNRKEFDEPFRTVYLSSAFYADHWSFTRCKDSCRFMLDESKHNFVCGFPYQLGLAEGLLMEDAIQEQMMESDFNEISWAMEMESKFWGAKSDAFFNYDTISKCRHIEYPIYPNEIAAKLPSTAKFGRIMPKMPRERRILSADIALMASTRHKNDATAIFITQLLPTRAGRYSVNVAYTETNEGMHTEDEALRIRKLYEEYDCDLIALDTKNVGLSIYDLLARDLTDPESGEIYPALSCYNNKDLAARCSVPGAKKAIWAITGSSRFNSDCAILLREGFRSGRVRLLLPEYDADELFSSVKGYNNLSVADKTALMLPYVNTTLLVNELINLRHETNGPFIKISERTGARKDRYSSLSYNYYVALQLERELNKDSNIASEDVSDIFMYRKPKQFR